MTVDTKGRAERLQNQSSVSLPPYMRRPDKGAMLRAIVLYTVPVVFAIGWIGSLVSFVSNFGSPFWDEPVFGVPKGAILLIAGVLMVLCVAAASEWVRDPITTPMSHRLFVVVAQALMLASFVMTVYVGV